MPMQLLPGSYPRPAPRDAATDPVGGADHSLPIRPERGSATPREFWDDLLHKRRQRKRHPPEAEPKPKDDDHEIDDYA